MTTEKSFAPKELLTRFLETTERNVLECFAKMPKAVVSKAGEYVFVPGTRKDRLLLVSHADTVNQDTGGKCSVEVLWLGDVAVRKDGPYTTDTNFRNSWGSRALGADDRAGCAMWFDLYDGTHSILITSGEESGLRGARRASHEIGNLLKEHSFVVEVDRRGDRQVVFYDVATDSFKKHIIKLLCEHDTEGIPWVERQGSCSDISHICDAIGICGVNLSAGYWNEHRDEEQLMLGAWLHTRAALKRILKISTHKRFELSKKTFWRGRASEPEDGELWEAMAAHGGYHTNHRVQRCEHGVMVGAQCYQCPNSWACAPRVVDRKSQLPHMPNGSISKSKRKKLAKIVRKLVEKGKISREDGIQFLMSMPDEPLKRVTEEDRTMKYLEAQKPKSTAVVPVATAGLVRCIHGNVTADCQICNKHRVVTHIPVISGDTCCPHNIPYTQTCGTCKMGGYELLCAGGKVHHSYGFNGAPRMYALSEYERCTDCGRTALELKSRVVTRTNNYVNPTSSRVGQATCDNGDGTVLCIHHCTVCRGGWKHPKVKSGRCQLVLDSHCPEHSAEIADIVKGYEADVENFKRALTKVAEPMVY